MAPRQEKFGYYVIAITLIIVSILVLAWCNAPPEKKYEALTSASNVIMALGAVAIPLVLYEAQQRMAAAEYVRSLHETWLNLDMTLLSSDRNHELMQMMDEINEGPSTPSKTLDDRKRKWIRYMLLNIMYSEYIALSHSIHLDGSIDALINRMERFKGDTEMKMIVKNFYNATEFGQQFIKTNNWN